MAAKWLAVCLVASVTALVFLPKGLIVFAALLATTTLLVPDLLVASWKQARETLAPFVLLAVLVMALALLSMQQAGQELRVLDNYSRFLLVPWCALIAHSLAPSRDWLWRGALAGIAVAFAWSMWDIGNGVDRAGAGGNPIVFANAVLTLLVVAVFCRPADNTPTPVVWMVAALLMGATAIVLSGSRGVMPGLGLLVVVAAIGGVGPKRQFRIGFSLCALLCFLAVLCLVPWLFTHMRFGNLQADFQSYLNGHVDSALGARLKFLTLSWQALLEHPWTGVGIDRFGMLVDQLPVCQQSARQLVVCSLGHAHNDVAQWGATLGIPGLLMIVALYLVPAATFAKLIVRRQGHAKVGAAWAGLMLVATYALSGLTQSMFAHAMSTSLYVVLAGLLLGLAIRESGSPAGASEQAAASVH